MACKEGTGQPEHFVEEIDYNEIQKLEVVGKGSFGVVWKGKWRGSFVAVKHIDSEAEKKAFAIEVRQLSRVSHPNIVKLHGACTQNPVCLVMEYAEGGSLYNVLHCRPQPTYTAGHAISWALQCAKGVAYLHNMKPKALIHRDLKPPNLLLIMGGKILKICDFGTACDKKTYMTNNKGSAAWMAPEVFEGSNYTEKCDIFSWGIILWEVLSRRKPFDDIGGSAFRIMWAVHTGERPPLIQGCPRLIEHLMTRCWEKNPTSRPTMEEVVHIMSRLFPFFSGYDEPVQYTSLESDIPEEDPTNEALDTRIEFRTTSTESSRTQISSNINGSLLSRTGHQPSLPTSTVLTPLRVEVDPNEWGRSESMNSEDFEDEEDEEYDLSSWTQNGQTVDMKFKKTPGLDKVEQQPRSSTPEELDNVYLVLDKQLHPVEPDRTCQESVQIFEQHKQLAQEYLKVQTEIAYLSRYMTQLAESLSEAEGLSQLDQQDSELHQEKLRKLENEKESLVILHRNLKRQLEIIKGQQRGGTLENDGWVMVSRRDAT